MREISSRESAIRELLMDETLHAKPGTNFREGMVVDAFIASTFLKGRRAIEGKAAAINCLFGEGTASVEESGDIRMSSTQLAELDEIITQAGGRSLYEPCQYHGQGRGR